MSSQQRMGASSPLNYDKYIRLAVKHIEHASVDGKAQGYALVAIAEALAVIADVCHEEAREE